MAPNDLLRIRRMRRHGIVRPVRTRRAARLSKLPLDIACALLEQESAGGLNVFGHDRTIFAGAGEVTREKYHAYKVKRGPNGHGGMQGVGPCQLTWYSLQDEADRLGGCWKPYPNMLVGFARASALIRRYGLRGGLAAYNGSGPAARAYARSVIAKARRWRTILGAPVPDPRLVYGDTDCNRSLLNGLNRVALQYGGGARIYVRFGRRTRAEQLSLWLAWLHDPVHHARAAAPGTSPHEFGLAADCQLVYRNGFMLNIGQDTRARKLLRANGLSLPVRGETWHVQEGSVWRA